MSLPASVAQGIEHWFPKPGVRGSNPRGGTREFSRPDAWCARPAFVCRREFASTIGEAGPGGRPVARAAHRGLRSESRTTLEEEGRGTHGPAPLQGGSCGPAAMGPSRTHRLVRAGASSCRCWSPFRAPCQCPSPCRCPYPYRCRYPCPSWIRRPWWNSSRRRPRW